MTYGTLVVVVGGSVVELAEGIGTQTVAPGGGSVMVTITSTPFLFSLLKDAA